MSDTTTTTQVADYSVKPFSCVLEFKFQDGLTFRHFVTSFERDLKAHWNNLNHQRLPHEDEQHWNNRLRNFNHSKKEIRNLWETIFLDNLRLDEVLLLSIQPNRLNDLIHRFCYDWYQMTYKPQDYFVNRAFSRDLHRAVFSSDKEDEYVTELKEEDWLVELWEEYGLDSLDKVKFQKVHKNKKTKEENKTEEQ